MCRQFDSALAHQEIRGVSHFVVNPFFFSRTIYPAIVPLLIPHKSEGGNVIGDKWKMLKRGGCLLDEYCISAGLFQ